MVSALVATMPQTATSSPKLSMCFACRWATRPQPINANFIYIILDLLILLNNNYIQIQKHISNNKLNYMQLGNLHNRNYISLELNM
jgi:hypothetical protein